MIFRKGATTYPSECRFDVLLLRVAAVFCEVVLDSRLSCCFLLLVPVVYRKLPVAGTCHTPAHNIHAKHVIHVRSVTVHDMDSTGSAYVFPFVLCDR